MTGILVQLKWESPKKRRKDNRLILLYKGKASVPTDDLIPKTRHCRNQHSMAFQTPIANTDVYKGSFLPQTIRDWNVLPDSLISSAKMQRIVLLSSLLWWELGTNSLITGPGEWLSFRRFTSKLSWSWSWASASAYLRSKRDDLVPPYDLQSRKNCCCLGYPGKNLGFGPLLIAFDLLSWSLFGSH